MFYDSIYMAFLKCQKCWKWRRLVDSGVEGGRTRDPYGDGSGLHFGSQQQQDAGCVARQDLGKGILTIYYFLQLHVTLHLKI